MKIGLLCSIVRKEEKLLIGQLRKKNLEFEILDDRELIFRLNSKHMDFDVVLERCINHSRAMYALKVLNDWGIKTVNTYEVADICGNNF
jgi:[lysine-biosynthesis-protein LysW]--L-2-aminoadipate ligase